MLTKNLEQKKYLDGNGSRVFVSSGITAGTHWMVVRQKNKSAGTHRVKSPALPLRASRDEAQLDLDAYAQKKGWREITG